MLCYIKGEEADRPGTVNLRNIHSYNDQRGKACGGVFIYNQHISSGEIAKRHHAPGVWTQ